MPPNEQKEDDNVDILAKSYVMSNTMEYCISFASKGYVSILAMNFLCCCMHLTVNLPQLSLPHFSQYRKPQVEQIIDAFFPIKSCSCILTTFLNSSLPCSRFPETMPPTYSRTINYK